MPSMTAHPDAQALADYLTVHGPRIGDLHPARTPALAQPGTIAVVYVETGPGLVRDVQVWLDPQHPADVRAVALAGVHQALHNPASGPWDCNSDRDGQTWLLWIEVVGGTLTADTARTDMPLCPRCWRPVNDRGAQTCTRPHSTDRG